MQPAGSWASARAVSSSMSTYRLSLLTDRSCQARIIALRWYAIMGSSSRMIALHGVVASAAAGSMIVVTGLSCSPEPFCTDRMILSSMMFRLQRSIRRDRDVDDAACRAASVTHRGRDATTRGGTMRFALMTEPQQGIDYRGDPRHRPGGGGGRVRGVLPLGPLRQLPGPGRTAHHRCLGDARGSGARDAAHPARHARVARHVPHPGRVRQGRGDRGRDERRAGRGRRRRRLERRRARPAGPAVPRHQGHAFDQMEEELIILRGLWDEPDGWSFEGTHWQVRGSLFRPRYDGTSPRADGRRRPNIIVGGTGKPRSLRTRRASTRTSTTPAAPRPRRSRPSTPTWTPRAGPSGATRAPSRAR